MENIKLFSFISKKLMEIIISKINTNSLIPIPVKIVPITLSKFFFSAFLMYQIEIKKDVVVYKPERKIE